jgi:3-deoxy-D-manno-octulosonic-acid transferase
MTYWVYNALVTAVLLAGLPFLPVLWLFGGRYSIGLGQRLGFYDRGLNRSVANSRPVWIHAASVGEILAAGRLADIIRTRFSYRPILLSAFTHTGYEIARQTKSADLVIFLPLDHPWIIRRALSTFDPSLIVFLETEVWPNFLRLAHRRGTPTVLLSGRFSARSYRKYGLFSCFFKSVLHHFSFMGMQTEDDADRARSLGADPRRVSVTGNLKIAGSLSASDSDGVAAEPFEVKPNAEGPHLLVAGSSHRGEEEILLTAFRTLKLRFPGLQMVLAPRHPQRFREVEKLLNGSGLGFEKKSDNNGRSFTPHDVLLLDTLGDLPSFYAHGDIAFVGGSLVDAGGHNLLEPARCRRPVLFGPHMANFAAFAQAMKVKGGGIEVRSADDLVREVADLLTDPSKRLMMGERAYKLAMDERRVGERSLALLTRYLQTS